MTALHWAAHWGDLALVRSLLAAGADVNAANRFGVTALHEAATVGQADIVSALLKAGAKPNARVCGEGRDGADAGLAQRQPAGRRRRCSKAGRP